MTEGPLSRRAVLRGLGTAMALPLLDAMVPLNAMAQSIKKPPMRVGFLFVPNGIQMEYWTPPAEGALNQLPSILEPLAGLKNEFNLLTNLTQKHAEANGDGPGDHARSAAAWLTGVQPRKTSGADIRAGISADQVIAMRIGKETRFASLELGCERGGLAGDCDSGYSCAYSNSISWRSENTPVAKEVNPRLVFERLFGSGDGNEQGESRARRNRYRSSILDFVLEDAAKLKGQLGGRDQKKIDEYFQGIREIELRLERIESANGAEVAAGSPRPAGIPRDYHEHIRLMGDMMILAFQADLTRVATFMFANEGSNRNYRQIGISEGHHDISHHGHNGEKMDKKRQIDRYHVEQLAYILGRMREIKEANGTLLDNTLLVYGGGISDGDRHNHDNLPILLAGKGGGVLRTGRHIKYGERTPMTNLFVAMMDRLGIPVETLGDSTGKLMPLF